MLLLLGLDFSGACSTIHRQNRQGPLAHAPGLTRPQVDPLPFQLLSLLNRLVLQSLMLRRRLPCSVCSGQLARAVVNCDPTCSMYNPAIQQR